jgi:ATP-dependent Lon protease
LNQLDGKIKHIFKDESVYKIPKRYNVFSGKALPSFIKDWLIRKFTDEYGELDASGILTFLEKHIPDKNSDIKNRLRTHGEEVIILTRFIVETDILKDTLRFSIPDLGVRPNEGRIPDYVAKKHLEIKDGEIWGVITLVYIPPEGKDKGVIELVDFKPFKPYNVDFEYFKQARKEFSMNEWINVLIRSMEYNPDEFDHLTQKLLFISRLLVFVEPNLNIVELAPKGTGKSYIFGNISKYGWIISGGTVTRAKLFFDISKNTTGIITQYDFVAMDEIETIKFANENELQGALKNFLEYGFCTVAKTRIESQSGLMLLGNIPLSSNKTPVYTTYFSNLPSFFQSSALMDRFHGFIEGWKLKRVNENLIVKGYTLNVEYFTEILHSMRQLSTYSYIVGDLLHVPKNADTRDTKAIKKLCTAYLKLLLPHIDNANAIDKDTIFTYCLQPALEKRAIIRKQLAMMDSEFSEELPDIHIK